MNDWIPLTAGWQLTAATTPDAMPAAVPGRTVPATVPGFVHTDLLAAGLIADPYLGRHEAEQDWIGRTGWRYTCRFPRPVTPSERTDLVFSGLDTVAEVVLNGRPVGSARNMHREYRFDVRDLLAEENDLVVDFAAILDVVEERAAALGELPHSNPEPYAEVRKMACNFGWDWGPALAGAGIWKAVGLHCWDEARIVDVRPHLTVTGATGHAAVDVRVERAGAGGDSLTVRATIGGHRAEVTVPAGADRVRADIDVPDPQLWWPIGAGPQTRYDLEVTLLGGGDVLDSWRHDVGFRSIRIDRAADADGSAFTLYVNDRPIPVRGLNWIPDDHFPTRVTPERYRERITQAIETNANLLRVWGGGAFESDVFFDICDELGVLTWQDFLFACAAYREDASTIAEVEVEARENITRLMRHPSLVLWCGNNENLWAREEWPHWQHLGDTAWGAGYYHKILPDLVSELDPYRPYIPGSPFSGVPGIRANDERHGTTHVWDVWNERDYLAYRDKRPRFVAEFGFCGPPAWATLARAVDPVDLRPDSPGMDARIKAEDGPRKLRERLAEHFAIPEAVADWHFTAQINQARAISVGVEHFRALGDVCRGIVLWQLNDCWPVISWSVVDGDGRRKPVFYALRAAYAPRLLTVQPDGGDLAVVLVNESAEPWTAELTARRFTMAGTESARYEWRVAVPAGATTRSPLPAEVARPADPRDEFIVVDGGPRRATWFFERDKALRYPPARFLASARSAGGDVEVTVQAQSLVRDLCLFPDRVRPDAVADDVLITLLPGEEHTFRVSGAAIPASELAALTGYPVLRAINDVPPAG